MALVVEDGTGRPDADSYVSVADALEYCARVGLFALAGVPLPEQEQALRRASQFLDAAYRFKGERLTLEQALEFPRCSPDARIARWPQPNLVAACAELAVEALSGPLMETLSADSVRREKVGPIETEYFGPRNNGQRVFALVEGLLRDLTVGFGNVIRVDIA